MSFAFCCRLLEMPQTLLCGVFMSELHQCLLLSSLERFNRLKNSILMQRDLVKSPCHGSSLSPISGTRALSNTESSP